MHRLFIIFSILLGLAFLVRLVVTPEAALEFANDYRNFASMHTISTSILISLLYALAFALTIPITTILALLSGFLFGFEAAFILIIFATIVGAMGIFYAARLHPSSLCEVFVGKNYKDLLDWAKNRPVSFMLATRFAPLVPFPIAHIIPAEAKVRPFDFLWTTLLGTVPATALFIAIGSGSRLLASGETLMARPYLILFGGLSLLALVTISITLRKKTRNAVQEIQKTRPSQNAAPRETKDE